MNQPTHLAIPANSPLHQQMQQWRHDIHRHPETAFEERRTSEQVSSYLQHMGLEVHTGIGITGIVAVLKGKQTGDRHIGLRADMDALPIHELNEHLSYCSQHDGKMHACGHDGHTAMLLGAAAYLTKHNDFAGTVYFIFQPAEEDAGKQNQSGAEMMISDGLFERFPIEEVYGMHNWPALAAGQFAVHSGPVMASSDVFHIELQGKGGHAAMPLTFTDPILAAGHLVTAIHSIVSRNLDPTESGLISIANLNGGTGAFNVIPETVALSGTIRALSEEKRQLLKDRLRRVTENTANAFGTESTLSFKEGYPATVNHPQQAAICYEVTTALAGKEQSHWNPTPTMGAEDFAIMLQHKPGAYIWIGNGQGQGSHGLHNPHYDFNDDILPLGASYWIELVKTRCPMTDA